MTRTSRLPVCVVASALAAALAPLAASRATTVEALTDADVVARAARVVHGVCTGATPRWSDDGKLIVTDVTIAAIEVIKGGKASEVSFTLPGGRLGEQATLIHGMPPIAAGDEVVLCLSAVSPKSGLCVPIGLEQGAFRVIPVDGRKVAVRRITVNLAAPAGEAAPRRRPAQEATPLADLLSLLRSLAR